MPDNPPADPDEVVEEIHEHLAATQELPVERAASRWIGEAEAVARDLAENDLPDEVVERRLGDVRELLSEVEDTGDEEADAHVEAAASLTRNALERLRD